MRLPLGEVLSSVGRGPMRSEEAAYLGAWFSNQAPADLSPLVELGASTQVFHETHPHVENDVLGPLTERGVRIVKTDLQPGLYIDIAGDIYDVAVQAKLKAVGAKCVLCCNILEHVADREAFARVATRSCPRGGRSWSPCRRAIRCTWIRSTRTTGPCPRRSRSYFGLHGARPRHRRERHCCWRHGHAVAGCPDRSGGPYSCGGGADATKARLHRLLWLFRRYRISVAVLRKPRPPQLPRRESDSMYSPPDQPDVPAPRIATAQPAPRGTDGQVA